MGATTTPWKYGDSVWDYPNSIGYNGTLIAGILYKWDTTLILEIKTLLTGVSFDCWKINSCKSNANKSY
jgi:hypothetical protein